MSRNRVREMRQERGLVQEELAHLTGLAVRTIWRIEAGENKPSRATRKTLARALKVPESQLFPREDVPA